MTGSTDPKTAGARHAGPAPGLVAVAYAFVFLAGLLLVSPFGGKAGFPDPGQPLNVMLAFFQTRAASVRRFGASQFGAAIPLGIFTATMVSRLRFLGIRAAGAHIALFGGFAAAFSMIAAGSLIWVIGNSLVTQSAALLRSLYDLSFALAGTVPFGLLMIVGLHEDFGTPVALAYVGAPL